MIILQLFDNGNGLVNTELHQKVIIQVSLCGLHIYMLKQYATGFSIAHDEKVLVRISDYDIQLLLLPQLRNMTHHHKIMCD